MYLEKVVICPDSDMDKSWGYADGYVRISHWNPHRPRDLQIVNGNATLVNASVSDDKWVGSRRSEKKSREITQHLQVGKNSLQLFKNFLPAISISFSLVP